jgi:hypothetical protein
MDRLKSKTVWEIAALIALSLLTILPMRAAFALDTRTVEYQSGVQLGHGYNAFTGEFTSRCYKGEIEFNPHGAAISRIDWEETTDYESIRMVFRIDASASYNAAVGQANGKTSSLSSFNSARSNASGMVILRLETSTETLLNRKLRPELEQLVTKNGIEDPFALRRNCGTHYVSTINYGGELYASLSHAARSEKDRSDFMAAFGASGFGVSASGTILTTEELEKYSSSLQVSGGMTGSAKPFPMSLADLRQRVAELQLEMNNEAKQEMKEWKRRAAPIDVVVVPIGLKQIDHDKLDSIAPGLRRLEALRSYQDQVEAIAADPDAYHVDQDGLAETAQRISVRVEELVYEIRAKVRKCSAALEEDMKEACNFGEFANIPTSPTAGLPPLYIEACQKNWTPPPLGAALAGLRKSYGDNSMGGNDTVEVSASYAGTPDSGLTQTVTVKIYEAKNDTIFKPKEAVTRRFFDRADPNAPGCYLTAPVQRSMPAGRVTVRGPNNYKFLNINSGYIAKAECRTDKDGEDVGYVGCREVLFMPVSIPIDHIEHINGSSPKPLLFESWLAPQSP